MQHAGSLIAVCKLLFAAYGIQFPDQELNSGPLSHWTSREALLWGHKEMTGEGMGDSGRAQRAENIVLHLLVPRQGRT